MSSAENVFGYFNASLIHPHKTNLDMRFLTLTATTLSTIIIGLNAIPMAQAQARISLSNRDSLTPGNSLFKGDGPSSRITSKNGCFNLVLQTDGNLVLYNNTNRSTLWSSRTADNPTVYQARLNYNGALEVTSQRSEVIYSSGKSSKKARYIILQNDGNLVVYGNSKDVFWSTNTVDRSYNQKNCRARR